METSLELESVEETLLETEDNTTLDDIEGNSLELVIKLDDDTSLEDPLDESSLTLAAELDADTSLEIDDMSLEIADELVSAEEDCETSETSETSETCETREDDDKVEETEVVGTTRGAIGIGLHALQLPNCGGDGAYVTALFNGAERPGKTCDTIKILART